MVKSSLFLVAGLAAGFALSAWLGPRAPDATRRSAGAADLGNRVAALESTLHDERARVAVLAAEVADLASRLESAARPGAGSGSGAPSRSAAADSDGRSSSTARRAARSTNNGAGDSGEADGDGGRDGSGLRPPGFPRPGSGQAAESRIDRFVAAGFSADRAAYLDRRASELRMQALEAEYEAARSGKPADPASPRNPEQALRDELGDADYERYLNALGRGTRVAVRGVLASSPAEKAGLAPGDEITSYDGRRIFDVGDLTRLTYEGRAGETVALDIVRNGEPMQIYVPRGPLGITGGRARFGGRP
jgi:hypothetical protein